ncbi:hypothetical protein GGF37_006376, partial [Kickxella alabastrina]
MHGPIGHNAGGFMSSPMMSQMSSLPLAENIQMHSQQGSHAHPSSSLVSQMRPYNMAFGMPGMGEQCIIYDDRMQVPPMPHQGGNWLRIRQPIDYVAPLKKPMNSFLLYSAERRVQLRQTHPDLNTTQQSTILAREWASLAEEEKEKYRADAKQLREEYNARRAELSLKLQQQLNQQHLNMSLAHQPHPLPHTHASHHQSSLDVLDVGMLSNDQNAHMQSPSTFGAGFSQQHYPNAGLQMPSHTQFSQLAPSASQGHFYGRHTPVASFSQTPHEDIAYGSSRAMAVNMSDNFQFDSSLSTLDASSGPAGQHYARTVGRNTPYMPDNNTGGRAFGDDFDKQ